jgi:small basic protein (TIGR04137 family)
MFGCNSLSQYNLRRTPRCKLGTDTWRLEMPIDKTLKVKSGAISNRNVLTRAERLEKLKEADRWKEGDKVLGMPKVRVVKLALKKKKKTKTEEAADEKGGKAKPAGKK